MSDVLAVRTTALTVRVRGATHTIVSDLDLAVRAGEVCGVVGESGAGKTIATRALLGLLQPELVASGVIQLSSTRVDLDAGDPLSSLVGRGGVVLQNPVGMFDPLRRMGSQLAEAMIFHRQAGKPGAARRVSELLSSVGFGDPQRVVALYPHQLSGGMAQRAALAMALATHPALLVVDEPTSALDVSLRNGVLTLLQRIAREESMAVVIVSHDLAAVGRFCDQLVVMYAGRVIEAGRTRVVLDRPAHPYTRALLAAAPTIASPARTPLTTIPGTQPRPGTRTAGCQFAPRCPRVEDDCRERTPALVTINGRAVACCHPVGE